MRTKGLSGCLLAVGLTAALACGSDGTARFTFLLEDVSVGGQEVDAYFFIPIAVEAIENAGTCWLVGFDLKGRAIREVNAERVTDEQDQVKGPTPETGTYAQYLGDEAGQLSNNCVALLDARFTFGGSAYRASLELTRGFPDPQNLDIPPGEAAWAQGSWSLDGGAAGGTASFWPYEYGAVPANALRVFPTEPRGR